MNRRGFLQLLGLTAIAAPVLAQLPIQEVKVKAPVVPEFSAWEQQMADDLVLSVKTRMNELVAEMMLKG